MELDRQLYPSSRAQTPRTVQPASVVLRIIAAHERQGRKGYNYGQVETSKEASFSSVRLTVACAPVREGDELRSVSVAQPEVLVITPYPEDRRQLLEKTFKLRAALPALEYEHVPPAVLEP